VELEIDYLKIMELELITIELELSPTKTLIPQINLPFNSEIFLPWQSYKLEYKLLGVGIPRSKKL